MPADRTWTDDVPPGYIPPGCGCGNLGQCAGCAARTAAIWTDDDIEAVRPALAWHFGSDNEWLTVAAAAVLDAPAPLIAARTRAEVAEEIAADLASRAPGAQPNRYGLDRETATERRVFMRAAGIARIHATTEEDDRASA